MNFKTNKHNKIALACVLTAISSPVFAAAGEIPWTVYLFMIIVISLAAAIVLSKRNQADESLTVKLLFGGMYFWVVTFIQLTVLSLIYNFAN